MVLLLTITDTKTARERKTAYDAEFEKMKSRPCLPCDLLHHANLCSGQIDSSPVAGTTFFWEKSQSPLTTLGLWWVACARRCFLGASASRWRVGRWTGRRDAGAPRVFDRDRGKYNLSYVYRRHAYES